MGQSKPGVYKRGNVYWIRYTDHLGKRVRKAASTDAGVAAKMYAEAITTVERLRSGMIHADPAESKRPVKEHLADYIADMERRGRDTMYTYTIGKRIEAAETACGWKRLRDCVPSSITAYLSSLATATKRRKALAPKTVNDHRADLSAFFEWCMKNRRIESNPCAVVERTNVKSEKKRRALSVTECQALLNAAPNDRRLVYLFLIYTGVRRGEAEQLTWGHVHMSGLSPYLELPATIAKSGKAEALPLVAPVADALNAARGDASDSQPLFAKIPDMPTFRLDLSAAGIERADERGRVVVLHSLRHSLCTMMAAAGIPMVIAQRIMRHRDIRLTAENYTDEGLLPLAASMRSLPSLIGIADPMELKATGTDCAKTVPKLGTLGHNRAQSRVRVVGADSSERQRPASLGTSGHVRVGGRKVGDLGFEPRLSESESLVLPLHQSPGCHANCGVGGQSR